MLKKVLLLSCLLFPAIAFSQSTDSVASEVKIVNDPLLWKGMLKLKSYQRNRIMEINEAFYNAIIADDKQRVKTKSDLSKLMQERSQGIWNTFSTRQKSIWKKLAASYGAVNEQAVSL